MTTHITSTWREIVDPAGTTISKIKRYIKRKLLCIYANKW